MKLHTIVIAIQLNKKIFRLSSKSGLLIDAMLDLRDSEKLINDDYFTRVNTSHNADDLHVVIKNDNESHVLIFQPDSIRLKIKDLGNKSVIGIEKSCKEFELFWKNADKIMKFPAIRSIAIVAEHRFEEKEANSASNQLMAALLKNGNNGQTGKFTLQYEEKSLKENGDVPDIAIDDYWSTIYSYYTSDRDETPENGKINANITLQKFYAPAKSNPLAELRKVKDRLLIDKKKFKNSLVSMGIE